MDYTNRSIYYEDAWSFMFRLPEALKMAMEALERCGFPQDEPLLSRRFNGECSSFITLLEQVEGVLNKYSKTQMDNDIEVDEDYDYLQGTLNKYHIGWE
jgi:hypothetical protein